MFDKKHSENTVSVTKKTIRIKEIAILILEHRRKLSTQSAIEKLKMIGLDYNEEKIKERKVQ